MIEVATEKIIDRQKVADTIHTVLDTANELLGKETFTPADNSKLRVIRASSSFVNSAVTMIQQETAMVRAAIVIERMKQLGYSENKQLK